LLLACVLPSLNIPQAQWGKLGDSIQGVELGDSLQGVEAGRLTRRGGSWETHYKGLKLGNSLQGVEAQYKLMKSISHILLGKIWSASHYNLVQSSPNAPKANF